jgi:hypothetical protein
MIIAIILSRLIEISNQASFSQLTIAKQLIITCLDGPTNAKFIRRKRELKELNVPSPMVDGKNLADTDSPLSELETSRKLAIILQILNRRIIVGLNGEVTDYRLNSPLVSLRWFLQDLSTPGHGEGGSEHVPLGAHARCTGRSHRRDGSFVSGEGFESPCPQGAAQGAHARCTGRSHRRDGSFCFRRRVRVPLPTGCCARGTRPLHGQESSS